MGEVRLTGMRIGDAGWLIERHAVLYAAEHGFDASFESTVAEVLLPFLKGHDPAREAAWIARDGEARLGSILCVATEDPEAARLRLFLLEPAVRGRGLGRRLLRTCLDFARSAGYRRLVLSTHESHRAACALYAASGFERVASRPVRSYGCDLVEQDWEIAL